MSEKNIFETKNFNLSTYNKPHVSRNDGGHLVITPKKRFTDRLDLSPELLVEMAWMTQLSGEAMTLGLRKRGIDIGIINYQDNKNWSALKPEGTWLHIHLYGRSRNAKIQKYGEALNMPLPSTGFYDGYEPLNDDDITSIREEIDNLLTEDRYEPENWHFNLD